MTATWMLYATCVAALAVVAGWFFDRPVRDRLGSTRGIWLAALGGAVLWPAAVALLFVRQPAGAPQAASTPAAPSQQSRSVAAIPNGTGSSRGFVVPTLFLPPFLPPSDRLQSAAGAVAIVTPMLLLVFLGLDALRVSRARRRWRPATIDGTALLVSQNFGPAIVGLWRPAIVIPEWALELPPTQRALILKHEAEHLIRHDSLWLGLGLLGLVTAPWNIGLWWLVRRLRLAMEMDCDQGVLAANTDAAQYGQLLLTIGQRRSAASVLAASFGTRRSALRVRIEVFTRAARAPARRRRDWMRFACGVIVLAAACSLGPTQAKSNAVNAAFLLAPNVADSVVRGDNSFTAVRSATGVPAAFRALPTIPADVGGLNAKCGMALIDDRDSTELSLDRMQVDLHAVTANASWHGPGRGAVGYYRVLPVGRYGVGKGEYLRVGCPVSPFAMNLRRTGFDRGLTDPPFRLDTALEHHFGITLDTLRRRDTRLDIALHGDPSEPSHQRAHDIAQFAWDQLGGSTAKLDTITVLIGPPKGKEAEFHGRNITWAFYPTLRDIGP